MRHFFRIHGVVVAVIVAVAVFAAAAAAAAAAVFSSWKEGCTTRNCKDHQSEGLGEAA